ncbi:MAG: ribosomal protein S18-alanine N-acetyltransferase [Oscillospiraceae bacterium]|nr:ribosomal protein S18-alanine N-acetyltransferase [Oscillospiraceae bacterium]
MTYEIVPMAAAHLDQVAALEEICFPEDPWSRKLLQEALENENTTSLLALSEDGRVLGYLFFTTVLDEGGVDNIAVHPEVRRQGIASALLDAFHRYGRAHGLASLFLEVRASNQKAFALYEKLGYREVGRRRGYYQHPREDAILMTLEFLT